MTIDKATTSKKKTIKKATKKKAATKNTIKKKSLPKKKKPKKITKIRLTEKQEAACRAYIECGGNQSEAYRMAYNCEKAKPETVWNDAYKLFGRHEVRARVLELQEKHAERHNVTVDSITDELDIAIEMAIETKQAAAITSASMGKAKLHGLIIDKKQDVGRTKPTEWNVIVVKNAS